MRTFDFIGNGKCLICKTDKEGKVFLAGIDGTAEDNNERAEAVHLECLDNIRYSPNVGVLYMRMSA